MSNLPSQAARVRAFRSLAAFLETLPAEVEAFRRPILPRLAGLKPARWEGDRSELAKGIVTAGRAIAKAGFAQELGDGITFNPGHGEKYNPCGLVYELLHLGATGTAADVLRKFDEFDTEFPGWQQGTTLSALWRHDHFVGRLQSVILPELRDRLYSKLKELGLSEHDVTNWIEDDRPQLSADARYMFRILAERDIGFGYTGPEAIEHMRTIEAKYAEATQSGPPHLATAERRTSPELPPPSESHDKAPSDTDAAPRINSITSEMAAVVWGVCKDTALGYMKAHGATLMKSGRKAGYSVPEVAFDPEQLSTLRGMLIKKQREQAKKIEKAKAKKPKGKSG